ncbi:MAG: triose-phosphate isomerase [Candidatus Staskawiczbacteria bacterium]|nr:triose-phosphate isomerase [Candidatus Staskawiczbacteria bacterium]
MRSLIIANWKMNPLTGKDAVKLFESVRKGIRGAKKAEVVICPPFVYLPLLKGLVLGAQNVFYKEQGAFTGEVSSSMLKDLKVEYIILGHSEVRKNLQETDEIINKKVKEVLEVKLTPIICVGEQQGGDKLAILEQQVSGALKGIPAKDAKNTIIAYEPVWAIGNGNNCSIEETMSSLLLIRKIISKLYTKNLASSMKVIYGGSVDSKNANSYINEAGANGLLVGGASLKPVEFIQIVKSVD